MASIGYRPFKPRTCGHIKDDGSRCGAFANSTGLCPSHAGSPGTKMGTSWDRENPYPVRVAKARGR